MKRDVSIKVETSRFALERAITGCLLGTAVGDAIGLPCEGLPRKRIRTLFGGVPDNHRLFFGRGMVSDDTEHTLLVADALTRSAGDPTVFQRELARGLRRWILLLPAGVGFATLRAALRLLVGISPARSGVFSAGNGAAMRSALLGIVCGNDLTSLRKLVHVNSRITHTDPKAEYGALAVAITAAQFAAQETQARVIIAAITEALPQDSVANELRELLQWVATSVAVGESTEAFASKRLGLTDRVSGYVYHTVPVALHVALSYPQDFRAAIQAAIECGGDTDTVAAIVGGIVGASTGTEGIPPLWLEGLTEWPYSVPQMHRCAKQLTETVTTRKPQSVKRMFWLGILLRNFFFIGIVLYHGLRRCLPPY